MSAAPTKDAPLSIIDEAKSKAELRVKELEPMVSEYQELTDFLAKLAAPVQVPQPEADAPVAPTSRKEQDEILSRQGAGKDAKPKARRNRKGGTAADKALAIITAKPGVSATDIANEMGIKVNYLYRVLGDLDKAGKVTKDGRNYTAA